MVSPCEQQVCRVSMRSRPVGLQPLQQKPLALRDISTLLLKRWFGTTPLREWTTWTIKALRNQTGRNSDLETINAWLSNSKPTTRAMQWHIWKITPITNRIIWLDNEFDHLKLDCNHLYYWGILKGWRSGTSYACKCWGINYNWINFCHYYFEHKHWVSFTNNCIHYSYLYAFLNFLQKRST